MAGFFAAIGRFFWRSESTSEAAAALIEAGS